MIEFNPDGSIKIPDALAVNQAKKEMKLKKERFILIKKELVDFKPKKCVLHLQVSEAFPDSNFVSAILNSFQSDVPIKLVKVSEREFDIEIGTDFKRCSDCTRLVRRFKEHLDENVIEEKGSCTLKEREFCYEDYF